MNQPMNRLLATCLLSACVAGNPTAPDALDAPGNPVGSLGIQGTCAHPLAGDGAVVFPDTAMGIQTSFRYVNMVNTGSVDLENTTQIDWTFEGADASGFTLDSSIGLDPTACRYFVHSAFVPTQSCFLVVKFYPTTLGPKQAVLHAVTRRPTGQMYGTVDQTFLFRANVVAAPATVVTDQPDLVLAHGGLLKIENRTAAAVDLGTFTVGSPFSVDPFSCGSSPLAAGDSCMVSLGLQVASGCPTSTLSTTTAAISVPVSGT